MRLHIGTRFSAGLNLGNRAQYSIFAHLPVSRTVAQIQRCSEVSWSLPLISRSLPSDMEVGAAATGNWSIFTQFLPERPKKYSCVYSLRGEVMACLRSPGDAQSKMLNLWASKISSAASLLMHRSVKLQTSDSGKLFSTYSLYRVYIFFRYLISWNSQKNSFSVWITFLQISKI